MTANQFQLTSGSGETSAVVTATGEIDLANVGEFAKLLTQAAESGSDVTVDLTEVSYCDSAALRELFSVAATAKLNLVVPATGSVPTLLRISGLDKVATVTIVD
ncbi:anti-anti-sigma regulatory factor (antagonist of anti-sigma factor) [Mycolicibacterium phlei]|jgi:anti-sigma B factor antagonist|uniref:Anti-sigma-factor antagonist n=1 Tax=Mycolicibacterium phlei DSM 43239 = CCUG 21000 TaxID=1226750 RepID=A0A5N5UXG4_MYCPH|nr:STAS domain-containing protein [Mycolicibacterium phlei]VEG11848.1 anti-anti-sigma regulatory factor (antagonist of anti-sigma factor) [Mycobacteroides chelonae]AMO63756.1 Putative anti-sigma factor antagonist [Mycolicibacterium phlei]EID11385.1 anti-anti-sigma factor [Mycolicibacterium phlei RIVM601174]KAB7754301.1 anti-sigma-factor antagonist [Mycolicibacterium phlei DSM 43239 = CCUG 21000]KXW63893.1 anti-sigma-factor antagonist [Mycolicibacterium phlei DSM 43239 = CCUG 21000]